MPDETDYFVPDFDAVPRPGIDDYAWRVGEWLEGTYRSNWHVLKLATYSTALTASVATQRTLEVVSRIRIRGTQNAEAGLLLNLNYGISMLGPSLGTVILASFAVESFVRLGYAVALERSASRKKIERATGFRDDLAALLSEFDGLSASQRVRRMFIVAKIPRDGEIEKKLNDLIGFRNDVAHDSPALHTRHGDMLSMPSRGKVQKKKPRFGIYESLAIEERPVRPKHVRAAIMAHDDLVRHALQKSALQQWSDTVRKINPGWGMRIQEIGPGTKWFTHLRELSREWERTGERAFPVDLAETLDFRDRITRRINVKLVK